jgi:hypothetical protein
MKIKITRNILKEGEVIPFPGRSEDNGDGDDNGSDDEKVELVNALYNMFIQIQDVVDRDEIGAVLLLNITELTDEQKLKINPKIDIKELETDYGALLPFLRRVYDSDIDLTEGVSSFLGSLGRGAWSLGKKAGRGLGAAFVFDIGYKIGRWLGKQNIMMFSQLTGGNLTDQDVEDRAAVAYAYATGGGRSMYRLLPGGDDTLNQLKQFGLIDETGGAEESAYNVWALQQKRDGRYPPSYEEFKALPKYKPWLQGVSRDAKVLEQVVSKAASQSSMPPMRPGEKAMEIKGDTKYIYVLDASGNSATAYQRGNPPQKSATFKKGSVPFNNLTKNGVVLAESINNNKNNLLLERWQKIINR